MHYYQKLKNISDTLKNSLPIEAPLLISKATDPCRAFVLREACLHKISELIESAYENFLSVRRFYVQVAPLFFSHL